MKYYLHDTDAFNDEKITELYMGFGYEGLGLFYTFLEKIAKQEKPIKTVVLKQQLHVGKKLEKCWNFMEEIGLISSNNGETFNKQLLKFSEKYQIKKEKTAKRVSEWRDKQELSENVTRYERVSNTPKVKESKVKESKGIREGEEAINSPPPPTNSGNFSKPTIEMCIEHFSEKLKEGWNPEFAKYQGEKFWYFYESKGWMVGKNKMKSWHSAAATWTKGTTKNDEQKFLTKGVIINERPQIAATNGRVVRGGSTTDIEDGFAKW